MDSEKTEDVHRQYQRHGEDLQSNDISMRTLSDLVHKLEAQQQKQFQKIMGILEEHGEKISILEMDCYKLKQVVCYTSEEYTSNIEDQRTNENEYGRDQEEDSGHQFNETKVTSQNIT